MTDGQSNNCGCKKQNADPLRGRKTEEEASDCVSSEKFKCKADYRINKHINKNQLVSHDFLLKEIKNKEKNQQIETGLKQLYRKSVNIVDIGIDCVAVNGKAKMRLDTEAAAAEKTSDSAEYMKQRNQYRVNIKKLR